MPNSTIDNGLPHDAQHSSDSGSAFDTRLLSDKILFNAQVHRPAIPNYEVLEELGRGGMGVVYRARDIGLKRHVAIKMLLDPEFASPEQRLRFKIEAESVAQLRHPNIVQVYELGELDGSSIAHPYMVLEFVEGTNLFRFMRQRIFTEREAAALMITLARAIQHAHDHGLIHRDLKPANILIQLESQPESASSELNKLLDFSPKITDFGLVKAIAFDGEGRRDLTRPELMVGTPQYMAPEQANPAPHALSCSVDIYSLGVIFYELLAGRLPFDDQDILRMLMEVQTQEAPSPRKFKPTVSVDLATICMKCLSKLPEQRYTSAAALADDLARYLNNDPIHARPLSEWQRSVKWVKRHPLVAGLTALLFTVITAALIVSSFFWRQAEKERASAQSESYEASLARDIARSTAKTAREAEQVAKSAETEAKLHEKAANRSLYFSTVAQADLLVRQGQLARPVNILNSTDSLIDVADVRSWEWYYLRQQCNPMYTVNVASEDYVQQVVYHPIQDVVLSIEGAEFYAADQPDQFPARLLINRYDAKLDKHYTKTPFVSSLPLRHLYLLMDGDFAVVADLENQLTLVDVNQALKGARNSLKLPRFKQYAIASKAGLVLLWNDNGGKLDLYDVVKQQVIDTVTTPAGISRACISSNGQRIAYSLQNSLVECWDRHQKKAVWTKTMNGPLRAIQLNATGSEMICLETSDTVFWDQIETSKQLYRGQFLSYDHIQFTDDGSALALIVRREQGDDVHVFCKLKDGTIKPIPYVLHGHRGAIRGVVFNPEKTLLASYGSDATVRVWNVDASSRQAGELIHRFSGHLAQVLSASFSPHSKLIATSGIDANIMYWQLDQSIQRDHRSMHDLGCGGEWISDYRFVHDTPWLAVFQHQHGKLVLLDMTTRTIAKTFILAEVANDFRAPRYDIQFSSDGKQLAVLNKLRNQVLLFDTVQGKLLWKTPPSPYRYYWLAFSGDGKRLLSAGHFPDPKAPSRPIPLLSGFQLWDIANQKLITENNRIEGFSSSWMVNHDGTKVAGALRTRSESYMTMYSVIGDAKQLWRNTVKFKNLISLAFSPDGETLAGVNFEPERNFVALWSVSNGDPRWSQFGNFEATQVGFTRDSKRVLTLGYASEIMMHDTLTGREVLGLSNRGKPRINDYSLSPRIAFNQDDTILATHSWDGTISFWHAFNKQAYDKNPDTFEKTKRIKHHTAED